MGEAIACEIKYSGLKFRCSDFRSRKENLTGAWNKLRVYCLGNEIPVPGGKFEFLAFGGKVTYYRSY